MYVLSTKSELAETKSNISVHQFSYKVFLILATNLQAMESLVTAFNEVSVENKSQDLELALNATIKHPAPRAGGCRIEGFLKVKKVCNC